MARAVTDGPPGREAVHEWTRFGVVVPLNDLSIDVATDARVIFDPARPLALRGRVPADDNRQPRTAQIGENPLPGVARGRTATYPLLLQAPSRQELDALRTELIYVFGETSVLNTMRIYMPGDPLVWTYDARALGEGGLEIDESALTLDDLADAETPYQWTATLSLWVPDPRFYVEGEITKGPFASASSHTCDNTGNAPTDPVVSGTKPDGTTTITLENTDYSTGGAISHATLVFAGVPSAAGDVVIDFNAPRSASFDDGTGAVTLLPYFDTFASNWWDGRRDGLLALNANTVKVTGLDDWSVVYREAGA